MGRKRGSGMFLLARPRCHVNRKLLVWHETYPLHTILHWSQRAKPCLQQSACLIQSVAPVTRPIHWTRVIRHAGSVVYSKLTNWLFVVLLLHNQSQKPKQRFGETPNVGLDFAGKCYSHWIIRSNSTRPIWTRWLTMSPRRTRCVRIRFGKSFLDFIPGFPFHSSEIPASRVVLQLQDFRTSFYPIHSLYKGCKSTD